MQLLWIILRVLFPTDPVQQCIGAARHRIALMASEVFSLQTLFLLEHDPQARLHIEALIIDYEAALHTAIGARACQIAKLRFRYHPMTFYRPSRALNTAALLKRIRAFVTMCNNIERLAQIRAERLKREHDANLLGCCPLRHAASQRATSPSLRLEEQTHRRLSSCKCEAPGGVGSRALARDTEGAAAARAPPVFDVYLNLQTTSQALPARSRPCGLTPGCSPGPDTAQRRPVRPRCAAAGCTSRAGPNAQESPS
jgi:hypothetical protein